MQRVTYRSFAYAALIGCVSPSPAAAPSPVVVPVTAWSLATWFETEGDASLEVVALRARGDVFDVVFNDLTFSLRQPGLAVATQGEDRVHVHFPFLGICRGGELIGGRAPFTVGCVYGWGVLLKEDGQLVKLDEAPTLPPRAKVADPRCPSLQGKRLSNAHLVEQKTAELRTAITALVLGEGLDDVSAAEPLPLTLVRCTPDTGEETVLRLAERVSSAAVDVGPGGEPVVAFVEDEDGHVRLRVARPKGMTAPTLKGDQRVTDALAACATLRIEYGPLPADHLIGEDANSRRCAMIVSEQGLRAQATEAAVGRCRDGDARSCTVAGGLMSDVCVALQFQFDAAQPGKPSYDIKRRFLPISRDARKDPRSLEFFDLGCSGGDEDACTRLLTAQPPEAAARSGLAKAACLRGNPFACDLRQAFSVR